MADLSQKADVLEYLKEHEKITSMEAIKNYGATRLSAIIHDLRHKDGYDIVTNTISVKNRYGHISNVAEYSLHA